MIDRIKKSSLSLVDDVGIVYVSDCIFLRAIHEEAVPAVQRLLGSGLIEELAAKGLFPKTCISDVELEGYSLVLAHEMIEPATYPFEWSPEMIRRAALCVLAVNECANKYGYELKDAHPYNIVFRYGNPVFVDFGSFTGMQSPGLWCAYNEFMGSFFYPLRLCEKQLVRLFKHMYLIGGVSVGTSELATILNPLSRIIGVKASNRFFSLFAIYRRGPAISDEIIDARFKQPIIRFLARFALKSKWLPFRKIHVRRLEKRIRAMNLSSDSAWANYHRQSGFYSENGEINLSLRMSWVVDTVAALKPKSIIELAGNQGILSRTLSKLPGVERVICTDYDENSIDTLLLNIKEDEKVTMACFNFMGEAWQIFSNERANRLRSEMVIALAVTHHLILAQNYNIHRVLDAMTSYSNKYLIVEFMPLGLWNGISAPPIPDWYNESWFVENLKCYCEILERKQLEDNRIVFVTRLKYPVPTEQFKKT